MSATTRSGLIGSLVVATAVQVPAAGGTQPAAVTVDGHYRIVSTDCYFAKGSCRATFDIEQSGNVLRDPSDTLFHGRVRGSTVHFGERWPPGFSEDSWSCSGTTADGGHTIKGTMTDGTGGSGTFVMKFLKP